MSATRCVPMLAAGLLFAIAAVPSARASGAKVSGRVVDDAGVAVAQQPISIQGAKSGPFLGFTDSSGYYAFLGLSNGSYVVSALPTGVTVKVTVSGTDVRAADLVLAKKSRQPAPDRFQDDLQAFLDRGEPSNRALDQNSESVLLNTYAMTTRLSFGGVSLFSVLVRPYQLSDRVIAEVHDDTAVYFKDNKYWSPAATPHLPDLGMRCAVSGSYRTRESHPTTHVTILACKSQAGSRLNLMDIHFHKGGLPARDGVCEGNSPGCATPDAVSKMLVDRNISPRAGLKPSARP